jgi:hypothetical protein
MITSMAPMAKNLNHINIKVEMSLYMSQIYKDTVLHKSMTPKPSTDMVIMDN